jgi:dihydroorotase
MRLGPVAVFMLVVTAPVTAQDYDLLLSGGHVIDVKNRVDAIRDVAIRDGRIAAVVANIAPSRARQTIHVEGMLVTPGLVDIHVHVYAGTGQRGAYDGDNSVYPDGFTFRSGVTTVVDAGSSGWRNFPDFKDRVIDRAKTRVLALLNIVGSGMGGGAIEQNLNDMDASATAKLAQQYRDVVVGIKTAHYAGPEWTPVERAVEAGTIANIPVMVDFGSFRAERPYQDLVTKKLRPGDISTHVYNALAPLLDDAGNPNAYLLEARQRGVIFDVGHGGGSFAFAQAVPCVRHGFPPDSISTDLHTGSMNAGMKNMLNLMSKFLNMGMTLVDVVACSTWQPAREIRRQEFGSLSAGAPADIAVLRLERGDFGFIDAGGARMKGTQKLLCELTLRDGRVVYDLNGLTREDWDRAPRPAGRAKRSASGSNPNR